METNAVQMLLPPTDCQGTLPLPKAGVMPRAAPNRAGRVSTDRNLGEESQEGSQTVPDNSENCAGFLGMRLPEERAARPQDRGWKSVPRPGNQVA